MPDPNPNPAPNGGAPNPNPAPNPAPNGGTPNPNPNPNPAPVEYKFNLPEGVKLEGDALAEFTAFAKDLALTPEAAQKFVDREIKLQRDADAAQADAVKKQAEAWESESRKDAEIGGAKYDENLGIAKKALETFGSKALQDMLMTTPLGKHPEVTRFLVKVGAALSQDGTLVRTGEPPKPADAGLRALYPSMYSAA